MVRGSGKFKTKRGGGRSFSRHLTLDENGTAVAVDRRRARRDAGDDDDDEDDDDDDDESEEESEEEGEEVGEQAPAESSADQPQLSRAERKEQKKKAKKPQTGEGDEDEDEDEDLINPNHVTKKLNISDLGQPRELSRREREQKEKKEAQERYWKLHAAGKTDQAKADLARLAKIKKEREEAAAKRKAEQEAKAAELQAKKEAARTGKR